LVRSGCKYDDQIVTCRFWPSQWASVPAIYFPTNQLDPDLVDAIRAAEATLCDTGRHGRAASRERQALCERIVAILEQTWPA